MMKQTVLLWPESAPHAIGDSAADRPDITVFRPDNAVGSAVIICPGGGYVFHADYEADPVAEWLNSIGIVGIVLRYRLAPRYHHPVPFLDVSRAMRLTRSRAAEWGIDPSRIGVMGFSAGGHLAAHISTRWDEGDCTAPDPIERFSSRPDFSVLLYPVITFGDHSKHSASAENLLGRKPWREVAESLSCERHVTPRTPPTFIYHATGDPNVPVIHPLLYAEALRSNAVPFELHLFDRVAHGVGLAAKDAYLGVWPSLCAAWLKAR